MEPLQGPPVQPTAEMKSLAKSASNWETATTAFLALGALATLVGFAFVAKNLTKLPVSDDVSLLAQKVTFSAGLGAAVAGAVSLVKWDSKSDEYINEYRELEKEAASKKSLQPQPSATQALPQSTESSSLQASVASQQVHTSDEEVLIYRFNDNSEGNNVLAYLESIGCKYQEAHPHQLETMLRDIGQEREAFKAALKAGDFRKAEGVYHEYIGHLDRMETNLGRPFALQYYYRNERNQMSIDIAAARKQQKLNL